MQVNWINADASSPYIFNNRAEWSGFTIRHLRVMAGELVEQAMPFHELSVKLDGSMSICKHTATGGWRANRILRGSVCFTPAGQLCRGSWRDGLECLIILLDPVFVAQTALENNFSGEIEFAENYGQADPIARHLGLALFQEADNGEVFGRMYAESLAQTLILHLLKTYTVCGKPEKSANGGLAGYKLRQAKEFIHENLERDLSLAEVAEAVGLSQFHFARSFRHSTGLTPQQYLILQRINRAKELLSRGELPLVEVSIQAGFKNQSHFTTLFRKFTAFTPKEFRESKLH